MVAIGSDHGGFHLKQTIMKYLDEQGIAYVDKGCFSEESVDYPDYGVAVAESVRDGECEKGIIICGTGIGISIAANKVPGIRAALCGDVFSAVMSREHNDANIVALGERVTGSGLALMIVDAFLNTDFAGGRHANRVKKLMDIEKKYGTMEE